MICNRNPIRTLFLIGSLIGLVLSTKEYPLKSSFLAALALAAFAVPASAQTAAYFPATPSTCANGQCGRISATVTQARATVANGFHSVGNVIAPQSVPGVWTTPNATPWYPAIPATVPQQMPAPAPRQPLFPRIHRIFFGR